MNQSEITKNNKIIAEWMGLTFHAQVHFQDYQAADYPESEACEHISDVWSIHKTLEYEENTAPSIMNFPPVVNEQKTPVIYHLKYHQSWAWLMPVVEKIMRESISRVVIYPPNYPGFNTPEPECWKSLLSNADIGGMNSRENLITSIYENVVHHIKMSNHGK